jgi:hypothetical protein
MKYNYYMKKLFFYLYLPVLLAIITLISIFLSSRFIWFYLILFMGTSIISTLQVKYSFPLYIAIAKIVSLLIFMLTSVVTNIISSKYDNIFLDKNLVAYLLLDLVLLSSTVVSGYFEIRYNKILNSIISFK